MSDPGGRICRSYLYRPWDLAGGESEPTHWLGYRTSRWLYLLRFWKSWYREIEEWVPSLLVASPLSTSFDSVSAAPWCQDDIGVAYLCQPTSKFATCPHACMPLSIMHAWNWHRERRRLGDSIPFFLESFIMSFSSRMFPSSPCRLMKPELTSC